MGASPGGDRGRFGARDVDPLTSPVRVGEEERDVNFSTGDGQDVSFETGPFRLNPVDTQDLAKTIEDLAADTPFDYLEETRWVGESIRHRMRLGYPAFGCYAQRLHTGHSRQSDRVADARVR